MRREGWHFEQSRWMVEGEKEGREGAGKKGISTWASCRQMRGLWVVGSGKGVEQRERGHLRGKSRRRGQAPHQKMVWLAVETQAVAWGSIRGAWRRHGRS